MWCASALVSHRCTLYAASLIFNEHVQHLAAHCGGCLALPTATSPGFCVFWSAFKNAPAENDHQGRIEARVHFYCARPPPARATCTSTTRRTLVGLCLRRRPRCARSLHMLERKLLPRLPGFQRSKRLASWQCRRGGGGRRPGRGERRGDCRKSWWPTPPLHMHGHRCGWRPNLQAFGQEQWATAAAPRRRQRQTGTMCGTSAASGSPTGRPPGSSVCGRPA